jgi:GPH family glycoside/pentoside/hexuronide:cation symporter/probable glucitol transport protein GutA
MNYADQKVSVKEKMSFGLAGLGQNMIYNFSATYIMIFYTDMMKLLPAAVGTLMLVARIWDAINDPIMGSIVDRTRTRWGKLRPYLFIVPIPMAIITILTFYVPDLPMGMRLFYAYATYILWDMIFTVSDVPYWGLSAAMSQDPKERMSILSYARILCNLGMAISIIVPPLIISAYGGGEIGYLISAILMSVFGGALFFLAFFNTRERVEDYGEKTTMRGNLELVKKNKPLVLLQTSRMLGAFRMGLGAAGIYFAKYNLGDEAFFTLLGAILIFSMIAAVFFTPFLYRFFTKKQLYMGSLVFGAIAHLLMFILGYGNMPLVFGLLFLAGMGLGMNDVVMYAMVGDSVDYLEYKTQKRAEGVCFSVHTFTTKLQTAFATFAIGWILTLTGFVENISQSANAQNGIFWLISLLPAIASVLSLIPMFFYDFTEKQHKQMLEEMHGAQ